MEKIQQRQIGSISHTEICTISNSQRIWQLAVRIYTYLMCRMTGHITRGPHTLFAWENIKNWFIYSFICVVLKWVVTGANAHVYVCLCARDGFHRLVSFKCKCVMRMPKPRMCKTCRQTSSSSNTAIHNQFKRAHKLLVSFIYFILFFFVNDTYRHSQVMINTETWLYKLTSIFIVAFS